MVIEACFIELVAYESSYVNFQETFIFLCLYCYVFYVRETSDLFLETLDHCLLHHYIHWWFDCSSWLDLSGLVLIHFPLIFLFLSWYFIHLAYIVLCSYWFTFRVWYFPYIILIHPITSSIFFIFFSFIIDIFILDYFFFTNMLILGVLKYMVYETIYIYCILYTRVWGLIIGIIEHSFLSFLSPYYLSLRYVMSLKTTLRLWHHILCLITLMWVILGIGSRAFWLWWTKSCGMTLYWGIATLESF